jgi:hypothetical protein
MAIFNRNTIKPKAIQQPRMAQPLYNDDKQLDNIAGKMVQRKQPVVGQMQQLDAPKTSSTNTNSGASNTAMAGRGQMVARPPQMPRVNPDVLRTIKPMDFNSDESTDSDVGNVAAPVNFDPNFTGSTVADKEKDKLVLSPEDQRLAELVDRLTGVNAAAAADRAKVAETLGKEWDVKQAQMIEGGQARAGALGAGLLGASAALSSQAQREGQRGKVLALDELARSGRSQDIQEAGVIGGLIGQQQDVSARDRDFGLKERELGAREGESAADRAIKEREMAIREREAGYTDQAVKLALQELELEYNRDLDGDGKIAGKSEEEKKQEEQKTVAEQQSVQQQEAVAFDTLFAAVGRNRDWANEELARAKSAYATWSKSHPGVTFDKYVNDYTAQRTAEGRTVASSGVFGMGAWTWPA